MKKALNTATLYKRFKELDSDRDDYASDHEDEELPEGYSSWEEHWDDASDDGEEYKAIESLMDEIESDFKNGIQLIHEDELEEYAKAYCEDTIGDFDPSSWPYNHIDWKEAGEELVTDYRSVTYDGETYYYQSY